MLDDRAKMMAYKAFVRSKIEYGNLIYWGAAEGYLEKLDRVQSSAVSMLADSSAFFIPSLESRRQAAAVGLTCKLLDGQGRGALSEVQPVFAPPTTKSTRSSDRIAAQRAAGPQHPHQLKAAAIRHTGNRPSLVTYKRSYRARIPEIWNSLDHEALQQQRIEGFIPLRKQLQRHIVSQPHQKS